jgi:Spy/CpxP family protein refolding chaperone
MMNPSSLTATERPHVRTRMRTNIALPLITFCLFAGGIVAAAQEAAPPAAQAPPSGQVGDIISHLNLTPDQMDKIKAIGAEQRDERQATMRRIRQAEKALDDAIYVENADESVIAARAKEVADARAEQVRLQALREVRIRRILTPEQLVSFLDLRRQVRQNQLQRRMEQQRSQNANKPGPRTGIRPGDGSGFRRPGRGGNGPRNGLGNGIAGPGAQRSDNTLNPQSPKTNNNTGATAQPSPQQ